MTSSNRNHYRVLAVAPDATVEEIEQSFRQLARRLHPDVNGGDGAAEERMKELNVARAALTDPATRAAYDEQLQREQRAQNAQSANAPPWPHAAPFAAAANEAEPLVSWMRTRSVPQPPAPTPEIGRTASLGRLFWITVAAVMALGIVMLLIWLHQALEAPP